MIIINIISGILVLFWPIVALVVIATHPITEAMETSQLADIVSSVFLAYPVFTIIAIIVSSYKKSILWAVGGLVAPFVLGFLLMISVSIALAKNESYVYVNTAPLIISEESLQGLSDKEVFDAIVKIGQDNYPYTPIVAELIKYGWTADTEDAFKLSYGHGSSYRVKFKNKDKVQTLIVHRAIVEEKIKNNVINTADFEWVVTGKASTGFFN